MPFDSAVLRRHLECVGRELYHVTSAQGVEAILTGGLRPGSEIGRVQRDDFFRTRRGHVYLLDIRAAPLVPVAGERALLRINLAQLKPSAFDTDEDLAQDAALAGRPWVPMPPPKRRLDSAGRELAGQAGVLAAWAEQTEGFDDPGVVAKSLDGGRIAYRGTIGPDALAVVDVPSEGAVRFCSAACEALQLAEDELPRPPLLAYCEVEVARARALADAMIKASLRCATVSSPIGLTFDEPYAALQLGETLWNDARAMSRDGEFDRSDVVRGASNIAEKAADPSEFGWPHQRGVFFSLAESAAEALTSVARFADHTHRSDHGSSCG
jgi:hypothetical protein